MLKHQHFFYLFDVAIKKLKIKMLIILDYKSYYLYFQYFNLLNLILFAFIDTPLLAKNLDFYYLHSVKFFSLEKILFISTVIKLYNYYFYKSSITLFGVSSKQ